MHKGQSVPGRFPLKCAGMNPAASPQQKHPSYTMSTGEREGADDTAGPAQRWGWGRETGSQAVQAWRTFHSKHTRPAAGTAWEDWARLCHLERTLQTPDSIRAISTPFGTELRTSPGDSGPPARTSAFLPALTPNQIHLPLPFQLPAARLQQDPGTETRSVRRSPARLSLCSEG